MKTFPSRLAFLALAVLAIDATLAASSASGSTASSTSFRSGVRAEIVDLSGNHPHTFTTVHLINSSDSVPLTIERVIALGPDGRDDVIKVLDVFADTVIPPLGEMRITLDVNTPGFPEQTTPNGYGLRNLMFAWEGEPNALVLSSAIVRHYASNVNDDRTVLVEQGYAISD